MNIDMQHIKTTLKEAGRYAQDKQGVFLGGKKQTSQAGDADYTAEKQAFSEIDLHIQKFIMKTLGKKYHKQLGIIAEETDNEIKTLISEHFTHHNNFVADKFTLLIDPVDGTRNYIGKGNQDFWGISICITKGSDPMLGAIYYPNLGIMLHTQKKKGVFINNQKVLCKENTLYAHEHSIRISGALPNVKEIREQFGGSASTGSFVITYLALLKTLSIKPALEKVDLPIFHAYIGQNVSLYDLGCCSLAHKESGGAITGRKGDEVNPFDSWFDDQGIIIQKELFILAPSEEYALTLLKTAGLS